MDTRAGRVYIDGTDLWVGYGITIAKGTDDFLKFPERKDSITHDWQDTNGIDVDLSAVYLKEKSISLDCGMVASSEVQFWQRHSQFLLLMTQPGTRRIEITELGRYFFIYYQKCTNYTKLTRIKGTTLIACKFILEIIEKDPSLGTVPTYLVDEAGKFIIT